MKVLVTLSNITEYGLDVITGNSREDLLARARQMETDGYEMYVNIPDVEGGDTDVPAERNVFQHYSSDLPVPDGPTHAQLAFDLIDQPYTYTKPCNYRHVVIVTGESKWICNIHDVPSRHTITIENLNPPCLVMDPLDSIGH